MGVGVTTESTTNTRTLAATAKVDVAQFSPTSTDDDIFIKAILVMFGFALPLYPLLYAAVAPADFELRVGTGVLKRPEMLIVLGIALILANLAFIGFTVGFVLKPLKHKWAQAVSTLNSLSVQVACEGVRDTLHNFRHLQKWRRFISNWRIPFSFVYAVVTLWAVAALLFPTSEGGVSLFGYAFPNAFGDVAVPALLYYAFTIALRLAVQNWMLSYSEKLDPTVQICTAIVSLHERWDEAARRV